MIAKASAGGGAGGGIGPLAKYILDEGEEKDGQDKVAYAKFTNCNLPDDASMEDAIHEIKLTQSMNQRTRTNKTYHLIVSFPPGETPTEKQLADIEQTLAESIGLGDHQRISALHTDTSHLHLHIAISKIHPETYKAITPRRDYQRLYIASRELEKKHNLIPLEETPAGSIDQIRHAIECTLLAPDRSWQQLHEHLANHNVSIESRGRGLIIRDKIGNNIIQPSKLNRAYSKGGLEKELGEYTPPGADRTGISPKAAAIESCGKVESFQSWAIRTLEMPLKTALQAEQPAWEDVHNVLAQHGLVIETAGRGLIIRSKEKKHRIKPSQIARELSRKHLENIMGAFQPSKTAEKEQKCDYQPTGSTRSPHSAALWAQYSARKDGLDVERAKQYELYNKHRKIRYTAHKEAYGRARAQIWGGGGAAPLSRQAKRNAMLEWTKFKKVHAARGREIKTTFQEWRANIVYDTKKRSWREWLQREAEKGTMGAIETLAACKAPKRHVTTTNDNNERIFVPRNHRALLQQIENSHHTPIYKAQLRQFLVKSSNIKAPPKRLWKLLPEQPPAAPPGRTTAQQIVRTQINDPAAPRYRVTMNGDLLYKNKVLIRNEQIYTNKHQADALAVGRRMLAYIKRSIEQEHYAQSN